MESENLEHTAVEGALSENKPRNPPDDKERERVEKDTKFVLSQSETDQQEGLSESAEGDHSNVPTGKEADQITEEKDDPTESEKSETNPALSEDKVPPELTLVILGDPVAVEPGPNLFLGPDKENEPFSFALYDLCGRVFVVYDLLKNTDHFPSDKDVSAFLLLLPHGHHVSQYESSVQWLKSSFGEEALDYLMTIVTHESNKQSEGAMEDLKDLSRFHRCSKSLTDAVEILSLLEKIDVMVSQNDPKYYRRTHKEGPEPAQGENVPAQGESGPVQGGPEEERPALGPEQEGPEQKGPGTAQGGPGLTQEGRGPTPVSEQGGPEQERPGTAQGGQGPAQGGPGPAQVGLGPTPVPQQGGPKQERPAPEQEGPGPAQGGPGPAHGGLVPEQEGPGPAQGGPGPELLLSNS